MRSWQPPPCMSTQVYNIYNILYHTRSCVFFLYYDSCVFFLDYDLLLQIPVTREREGGMGRLYLILFHYLFVRSFIHSLDHILKYSSIHLFKHLHVLVK